MAMRHHNKLKPRYIEFFIVSFSVQMVKKRFYTDTVEFTKHVSTVYRTSV